MNFKEYVNEGNMQFKKYVVSLKHDNGTVNIKTVATSEKTAKENVLNAENAPASAVISVKEVK